MASLVPSNDEFRNVEEKISFGEVCEECKLVVIGIDFGTAFSGIAFAFRVDPTSVSLGSPSSDPLQMKDPTSLLRLEDGTWKFGYEAEKLYYDTLLHHDYESGAPTYMQLFKGFKMVLKDATGGYDTLTAPSVTGTPCLLMQLITESLRILKDYALKRVCMCFGVDQFATRDVQWVLTVPAIWNEFGKSFMRKAAFAAGWIDEEDSDNLLLVLESEAAALAVYANAYQDKMLDETTNFMMLACGGGIVDITVHEVTSINPFAIKTISVPSGGDWGGDHVKREFKKYVLGPDLNSEGPHYCNMINREVDRSSMNYFYHKPKIIIRLGNDVFNVSRNEWMSLYEPFLRAMVNEMRRIMASTPNIRRIMVVGGFAVNDVLIDRIKSEFHNKLGVRVILPSRPRPRVAVVYGAVCFGLYKNAVQSYQAADRNDIHKHQVLPLNLLADGPAPHAVNLNKAMSDDCDAIDVLGSGVPTPPTPAFPPINNDNSVYTRSPSVTPTDPSSPHLSSWLAVRLLESGVDAQLAKDCELKLVVQEGFVSETHFAEMLPSELDSSYLKDIGIVGRGVQLMILRLHKELYAQFSPTASTPSLSPPPVLPEIGPNPINPPTENLAYSCGTIPIEDIQPLVTDAAAVALHGTTSSRLLLRGRFIGTINDLGWVYTKEYACVIKCAGRDAQSAADSDGAKGIQREFSVYESVKELAHLKGGKLNTGCIACYHMHPSAHYLVLEAFGQDIRCLLVPNFKLAPQLAEAIIAAVATFHSLGIVHCDIKPHNILFELDSSHSYIVKLCDLDGAHMIGDSCAASQLGTMQYEAPEVYIASRGGEKVTAALSMDIFSLGLVLWQVLSRSPYPPMSVEQLQECYSDQNQLFSCVALSESMTMYQSLLYSCVKLKPSQERISSDALYQRVRDIAVSKAHPGWHRAQQENVFLKEKVSDKLDGLDKKLDTVLEVMKARFDALGGEVVGMAEVLRREILLGHEGHSRVLVSLKEATQDALELLSEAQEATNTSSAEHTMQILSCIEDLHSRVDRDLAIVMSRDNTSSSSTEVFESLLRGVSDEFHARFDNLSTHLQEQVKQQSTAGADSARARSEALAMNQALTVSLQEALKGIAAVQSEVFLLKQGQEQLGVQVGRVLRDNKRLDTMLRTLIVGTHNIPTYAIILPVVAKTWLKKADPMRLVRNKYRLYFLCSHTHQIAPCGPKGEGYKITVTKQWVRDAAPVLMAALVMLKLALMAGGIPLPIPDLSSLLTSSALHVKFLDAALHLVQNPPEDHGTAEFAMDKAITVLGSVGAEEVMEDIGRRRVSLEEGSLKAYATIRAVLTTDSIDIALSSGLRQVVHPVTGRTAWVLDNDSVAQQYCASV